MEFLTGGRQNEQTIHNTVKAYKNKSLPGDDNIIFIFEEPKMPKDKERCKYCVEYNGDCVEEACGFDYYSCELKNKEDLEKYGTYWSFDNRVDEDECDHYLCKNCLFRKENNNMSNEELTVFNTNDWEKCIDIMEKYWNDDYGTFDIEGKNNNITLTLTTGGWSENEEIINLISGTMFWFLWWQESKRGGYYKFTIVDKIEYEKE